MIRIKLGTLKQLIREVAMSPAVQKEQQATDPMTNKNVVEGMSKISQAFGLLLTRNLVLANFAKAYNQQTREFDDNVYKQIKDAVTTSQEKLQSRLASVMQKTFAEGSQAAGEGGSKAA